MMWNQNDTKYIIKRLILYIAISCIVFFGAQSCAKAAITSDYIQQPHNPPYQIEISGVSTSFRIKNASGSNHDIFGNRGSGYFVFTMQQWSDTDSVPVYSVSIQTVQSHSYQCELGNFGTYFDNHTQVTVATVKCAVDTTASGGIRYIIFDRNAAYGTEKIVISELATWTDTPSEATSIINSQQSVVQQQIQNNNANTQAIQNTITSTTQQEINAINAATQATNDNTAAINAQTQWQQQDFNSDTTQIDAITDLISAGDKNKIRDLMMFPARILMLIGAHIGSDYCTAYNLGSLYGTNLILPCINWKNYVGVGLYNTIDTIISIGIYIGLIIYVRKLLDYAFSLGATTFESVNVEVFN